MRPVDTLRQKLDSGASIVSMGVWDVMSGKIADRAGFDMVALQSFQHSFGWGLPDMGVVTPDAQCELTWKLAGQVATPILVDLSNGFGDVEHAAYWASEFERAGAAALHIGDPEYEKCPFLPGPAAPAIPADHFVRKLEAVIDSRRNDIVVIARTRGGDEAQEIRRLRLYKDAGADALFVGLKNRETLVRYRGQLDGPLMLQGSAFPPVTGAGDQLSDFVQKASFEEVHALGYQIYNYYGGVFIAYRAFLEAMNEIREHGDTRSVREKQLSYDSILQLVDIEKFSRHAERATRASSQQ
jgi:2-methylisocitrate lyase-like PEP mutase family enzyme